MKKIVTTTITPASVPTWPIRSPSASNSGLSVSPAFRSRSASSFAFAHLRLEEAVLEAEEGDDREEADADEGVARVPGAVAGESR